MKQYREADEVELADADALVAEFIEGMNALARRHGDANDTADGVIACSMPRKQAHKIKAGETKKLADFGRSVYEQIADNFWSDYYGQAQTPHIEESLEVRADGSVCYSATFLPTRFAPDLPEQDEA